MAPIVMHAVIGEHVYAQIEPLAQTQALGSFLLGCMLVDVNAFSDLDRRRTHFAGQHHEDGEDAFHKGSLSFLAQLDGLLQRPWPDLAPDEQAFVAGYLCHLAADEAFKSVIWRALSAEGITSVDQLPASVGVILTAYSVLSVQHYLDGAAVANALRQVAVPDVLTHVPHQTLARMWRIVQPYSMDHFSVESYMAILEKSGRPAAVVEERRRQHERHMEDAITYIQEHFDVQTMIQASVDRSLEIVPRLWSRGMQREQRPDAEPSA